VTETIERRSHPRVRVALDGLWQAASKSGFYRVADLSLGGCFLQSSTSPAAGDTGLLTIYFPDEGPLVFKTEVVYANPCGGFAVRFPRLTGSHLFQLGIVLQSLKEKEHLHGLPIRAYIWSRRTGRTLQGRSGPK
jgi:PilZ domain-containing protein